MRIPLHTKKPRFYVATNDLRVDYQAISRWNSFDKAVSSILRLKKKAKEEPHYYEATYNSITKIVETGPGEHVIHSIPT